MSVTINGSDGITTPSLEVDSNTLVVDEVNNRVGIGTTSPSDLVDISADNPFIRLTDNNQGGYAKVGSVNGALYLQADQGDNNIFPVIKFDVGGVEVGQFTDDGNLKFNSGYGSVATAYGCRAWVNFNGQGTPSIRGSGNVSSITDITVGEFSVNFATAMPDTNFGVSATTHHHGGVSATGMITGRTGPTATQVDFYIVNVGGTAFDPGHVYVAIHR